MLNEGKGRGPDETPEALLETRLVYASFDRNPFFSFLILHPFCHRIRAVGGAAMLCAANLAEIVDVKQMEKIVPLISVKVTLSKCLRVGVWCRHILFGFSERLILFKNESRTTLWGLVVGLLPLMIILNTAALSSKK